MKRKKKKSLFNAQASYTPLDEIKSRHRSINLRFDKATLTYFNATININTVFKIKYTGKMQNENRFQKE